MVKRVLIVIGIIVGLLVLFAGTVQFLLQPQYILTVPPQERLVFSNVTVVNPGLDRQTGQTVIVEDGHIVSITASSPDSADIEKTTHFAGTYMLPGLIDMHVHHLLVDQDLHDLLFLMHGITTIRNIGFVDTTILDYKQKVRDGIYPGPRYFACGPILDGDPPWPQPWFWSVPTPDEARTAVDKIAAAGVDCVKVYSGVSAEVLIAIRAAAKRHGLPVIGHLPFDVPYEAAQVTDVQHLGGIPATPHQVTHTEADRAAQLIAFMKAWPDLDEERIDFIIRTSVSQGIAHTPTHIANVQLARRHTDPQMLGETAADLLPRWYRELWQPSVIFGPFFDEASAAMEAALPKMNEVIRRMHQAGVRIHLASDVMNPFIVPGASLHQELQLFVEAGLTPGEAWVTGTRWPGEFLGLPKLGTLQAGAPADFLLLGEDPTQDLAALSTLEAVVTQGRLYPKPVLDEAYAQYEERFNGWLYDSFVTTAAKILF